MRVSVAMNFNKVQFRGFLNVKGNLTIGNVTNPTWNMVGSLLVGDLTQPAGTNGALEMGVNALHGTFNVVYDDVINHRIHVAPSVNSGAIRIEPDVIQAAPTFLAIFRRFLMAVL